MVLLYRFAGVMVAASLVAGALAINRGHLGSTSAVYAYFTVVVGLGSFVLLSTLTRMGHARMLEDSIVEVRGLTEQLRDLAEKDPLTGLADGVSGDMVAWVNINFKSWHEGEYTRPPPPSAPPPNTTGVWSLQSPLTKLQICSAFLTRISRTDE